MSGARKSDAAFGPPPGIADIVALAEQAVAAIPRRLAKHIENVSIAVEEIADEETVHGLGLESGWELTGLYQGIPLTERSNDDIIREPDLIVLYRQPILLEWVQEDVALDRLVRNVVVHEIAHHFGFSDAEIAAIEQEME